MDLQIFLSHVGAFPPDRLEELFVAHCQIHFRHKDDTHKKLLVAQINDFPADPDLVFLGVHNQLARLDPVEGKIAVLQDISLHTPPESAQPSFKLTGAEWFRKKVVRPHLEARQTELVGISLSAHHEEGDGGQGRLGPYEPAEVEAGSPLCQDSCRMTLKSLCKIMDQNLTRRRE